MAKLIIVRGLPGSGKSTIAQVIVKAGYTFVEADMFHTSNNSGEYNFKLHNRPAAREWTDETVANLLRSGQNVVLCGVFATNDLLMKFKSYCDYAGHGFTVIHMEADHGNVHEVPEFVLEDMALTWEALDLHEDVPFTDVIDHTEN